MADITLVGHDATDQNNLHNMAEDLKVPLTRILAHAQIAKLGEPLDDDFLAVTADSAIRLIDSYLISSQIYNLQQQLALEPVSVAAVVMDVSRQMSRLARQQNMQIQVIIGRRNNLVMAHATALHAALTTLAYSLLQAGNSPGSKITMRVEYRAGHVLCGVFGSDQRLNSESLETIRRLRGRAARLSNRLVYGSSSGIAIADSVFDAMGCKPAVKSNRYGSGLVAQFLPSTQLALL